MRRCFLFVLATGLLALAALNQPARAQVNQGWIPFTWSEDGTCYFGTPGSFDCQAPVLTFTVTAPATVKVTDAGEAGGVWEIVCSGLPSPVIADSGVVGGEVVTDPDQAFAMEQFSKAEFTLPPGTYHIAIRNLGWWDFFLGDLFPYGFIRVDAEEAAPTLADLAAAVSDLAAAGALNRGQAQALLVKVNNAAKKVEQGKPQVACNMLQAFLQQVADFAAKGVLSEAGASRLAAMARAIMADLCS